MAASPLQLDFGHTFPALTTGWPSISALRRMREPVPDISQLEAVGYPSGKVLCRESQAPSGEEGMPPEELQEFLWQDFFGDPPQWWDNRRSKRTFQVSKVPLWLNNRHKPAWMELQLSALDAGMKMPPESVSTVEGQSAIERLGAHEGPLEIGMCRKLCENGRISDAVDALNLRVQQGCHVNNNLFYRVLKRCIAHNDLVTVRRIHALSIKSGYEGDAFLATHLISLYASHGSLEEAMQVFTKVRIATVYNWTTIIFAYARHGEAAQAIRLYRQMLESTSIKPDNRLYVAVLKACATAGDLVAGKEVHARILATPGKADTFVQAGLVNMYAKCGSLVDARRVFDRLPERDVVTWTALISGYTRQGMGEEALSLYSSMQQEGVNPPDSVIYVCLLQACASVGVGALDQGKQLHAEIEERGLDLVLGGSLVNMYAKCGSLGDARRAFDRLSERDVVTWTALIAGYTQQGMGQEALSLYSRMQQEARTPPDAVTYVCLLQACAIVGVGALDQGRQLHAEIEEQGLQEDLVLGGSLVNMYAKCGSLGDARSVFDRLPERNVVTWNALLAGYGQEGMGQEALSLYSWMQQVGSTAPDSVTYMCLLQACASVGVGAVDLGKKLHAEIEERGLQQDFGLCGSLVRMYARFGSLGDARRVFDRLPNTDVVTWNALLAGYAQQGMGQEALNLYSRMQQEGLTPPNSVTYVWLLQACASVGVGALDEGKQVHAEIEEQGLQEDLVLGGSIVNMYAKCGSVGDARRVFDTLPERNVVTWNALLAGYAQQGMGQEALRLYVRMQHEGSTAPDSVTYVCLLQACASVGVGALDQGKQLHAEIEKRGLKEDLVVSGSLVNMYAKCGSIWDARRMFDRLPERNVVTWTALIAGYTQQGMGEEALSLYSSMQQDGLNPPDSVTYVCLLQACARVGIGALDKGRQLHAEIEEQGLQEDLVLGGNLVNMYAKCGSLVDARLVFDRLPERNVVTWTALIAGYVQQGMGQEALSVYSSMQHEGLNPPNSVTYTCLLQACAIVGVGAADQGKQLHAEIEEQGLQEDLVLGGSLVNMYAKCGSLRDARRVFDRLPERTVVTWNAMLAGYAQQGMGQEALSLYSWMQQEGSTAPDSVTYVCLLQACASVGVGALDWGKKLHAQIEERHLQEDSVLGGCLVNMYAKCGSLGDALCLFDRLPERNVLMWNALLAGYAQQGMGQEAFSLYVRMQQEGSTAPDSVTYMCLLQACASVGLGALDQGKHLHAEIEQQGLDEDLALGGSLVNMYAKCGSLGDARKVFDRLPARDVVTWTALIAGYTQQGMGQEALSLYTSMRHEGLTLPNSVTYVCLLQACACVGVEAVDQGKQLHVEIEEQGLQDDMVLGGSLVNMYAKCGSLGNARRVFERLPERNVVTWTALIAGYAQKGMGQEALSLYGRMQHEGLNPPNSVTYICLLQACASLGAGGLDQGKQLHAEIEEQGLQKDLVLGGSLVNMYAKCGSLGDARRVFDRLPERDVVTWTALIAGYAHLGMGQEALSLYSRMQQECNTAPDSVTFVCLLQACASLAALPLGKQLHAQIEEQALQADVALGAGLVNMYAKCGSMFDAQQVFDSLAERSIEAWNALTSGYARQGDSEVVFDLVDRMRLEGLQPDGITFLCLLTVCSHVGQVEKGHEYFEAMKLDYGISPTMEHYKCMVDLVGRAGHLDEALRMARTMPFLPDITVWHTLLGACRKWGNVEIGQQAFEFAVTQDGQNAASYVLMASIYASAEMWEEAKEMQARRVKSGAWKEPGQSWWTDMGGVAHTFVVGYQEAS